MRGDDDLDNCSSGRNGGAHCLERQRLSTDGRLTYPPYCPHPELGQGFPSVEPMRLPWRPCAIMAEKLLQQLLRAVAGHLGYLCVDGAYVVPWYSVLDRPPWFKLGSSA